MHRVCRAVCASTRPKHALIAAGARSRRRSRILPSDAHLLRTLLGIARSRHRLAVDAVEHFLDGLDVALGGLVDEPARDQPQLVGRAAVRFPGLAPQLEQDGAAHQPAVFAGLGLLVDRDHDVSCCFEAPPAPQPGIRGSEVIRRRLRAVRVVVVESEGGVAFRAKQAAYHAGRVAMIDAQQTLGLFPADCANAVLACKDQLVLLEGNPVAMFELVRPFDLWMRCRFASAARVDLRSVSRAVGTTSVDLLFPVPGILRISFSPALASSALVLY